MNAKLLASIVGLTIAPFGAWAQEHITSPAHASEGVDPAVKEFIAKFRDAIKEVKDLSCTVEHTSKMDDKTEAARGECLLTVIRPPGANGAGMVGKFRVSAKSETGETTWAFDGKKATRLQHDKKTFAAVDSESGQAFPPMEASMVMPTWVLRDVLSDPRAKITGGKMLPEAKVGNDHCKVVQYTVELPMMGDPDSTEDPGKLTLVQTRHVGEKDLLPRKIESVMTITGPQASSPRTFSGVYSNLKVNTNPEASAFLLKEEPGFTTVEAEPQELGVPSTTPPKLKFAAGDSAPDFALKTPEGKEVTLASLKGKVVLLDFWAVWCHPCKEAMPKIQELHEKYKGKDVAIIGVNSWERGAPDIAQKYMEKNKYTYGLLLKGEALAQVYGITGIPTLILIGPDGKVIHTGVGFQDGEEEHLASLIDKALAAK